MWSLSDPAQVALIGFGGTLVTAAAGVIAAKLADHNNDGDRRSTTRRILDEIDELRERVGILEHERGLPPGRRRRRRPAPPA